MQKRSAICRIVRGAFQLTPTAAVKKRSSTGAPLHTRCLWTRFARCFRRNQFWTVSIQPVDMPWCGWSAISSRYQDGGY